METTRVKSNPTTQTTNWLAVTIFQKINGVVIGHNHGFESNKLEFEEIFDKLTCEFNFPILKINEFGHYQPHAFLPIGARVKVDATNKKIKIIDDFVE